MRRWRARTKTRVSGVQRPSGHPRPSAVTANAKVEWCSDHRRGRGREKAGKKRKEKGKGKEIGERVSTGAYHVL